MGLKSRLAKCGAPQQRILRCKRLNCCRCKETRHCIHKYNHTKITDTLLCSVSRFDRGSNFWLWFALGDTKRFSPQSALVRDAHAIG